MASSSSSSRWPRYQQRLRQAAARGKDTQWRYSSSVAFGALGFLVVAAAALYWSSGRSASLYAGIRMRNSCNYSQGSWVVGKHQLKPLYDESCSDIFPGWKCAHNGRANAREYLRWRWQPRDCDLPRLDPRYFLERLRGKSIGFVGDSISRNMYTSLVCSLKSVVGKQWRKERPINSDKGVVFFEYNVTVAYHRTNLLARYGPWKASSDGGKLEKLGYQRGYRVDVDVPQGTWSQVPGFHDIIIMNTGHWWFAPEKFYPGMLFFEGGQPIVPPLLTEEGLELTVKHMLRYVERNTGNSKQLKYLRLQSPRHFEGGDWRAGGTCHRPRPLTQAEVDDMFDMTRQAVNREDRIINKHLVEAAGGTSFRLLDVTTMSEFRADGHPSTAAGKQHEDCMHWCLPGVTDFWNDLLVADVLSKG